MKARMLGLGGLAMAMAILALASACTSMPAPNNPTTQTWSQTSAMTGAVAATVAATAPAPWGQIIAGILGAAQRDRGHYGTQYGVEEQRAAGGERHNQRFAGGIAGHKWAGVADADAE